jgi:hypothetical protein
MGGRIYKMKKLLLLSISIVMASVSCQSQQSPAAAPTPVGNPVIDKNFKIPSEPWCGPDSFDFGDFYCQDGEFHLVNKGSASIATSNSGDYMNFILQVQMRLIGEKGAYGVVFRGNNTPAFYVFEIHPDGKFQLIIWGQSPNGTILIPWTESAAIKQGGATNLLEVIAQGTCLALFVNNTQLAGFTDNTFIEGVVGPVALEDGHAAVRTTKVWELPVAGKPLNLCIFKG